MTDLESRIARRAEELRRRAEATRVEAERQIAALLTAAAELDALLAPPAEGEAVVTEGVEE